MSLSRYQLSKFAGGELRFWMIYPLSVLFMLHNFLTAYINSTYMEQYISAEAVGALFTIGSALAVIAFLFFSHALRAFGNVRLTLLLAVVDLICMVVLGVTEERATAIVAFVALLTVNPLLFLNIDIFSESLIGNNETSTGSKRGLALTLMSLAGVVAPLMMGIIVGDSNELSTVYFYSAGIFSVFILFLLFRFRKFSDPLYPHAKVRSTIRSVWVVSDLRNVMCAHFLLQMFFVWTVIYIPLYLATEIGLPWSEIAAIIAVGMSAYVLFEWPLGYIADRFIGEKEIMALGFVVLAVSSSWIAFMNEATIVGWMVLIFITRVGASMVEASTESYFFKHTTGGDAGAISLFRLLRPLATIFGALLGSAVLLYLPFSLSFIILGAIMVPGIYFTVALKDTK